jgi:hypothetical protein
MSQLIEHSFKPRAIATGFQSYNYFPGKPRVKSTHVIPAVIEFAQMNFSIGAAAVRDGLDSRVKVDTAIYCQSHGRLRLQSYARRDCTTITAGGACFIPSKIRED